MTRPLEMAAHADRTDDPRKVDFWFGFLAGGFSAAVFIAAGVLGAKLWG